jgi:DMSO/TMAO reductase YedYZ molybdopterin-dependent catalytic subunit
MDIPKIRVTGLVTADERFAAADLATFSSVVTDVASVAPGAAGAAVRVGELLDRVTVDDGATHCTVISQGGAYRASIPLDDLRTGGWLAFAEEGRTLPDHRGGPFRLTVAEGSTLCWNVKRVATLRLTAGAEPDDVPENPPH